MKEVCRNLRINTKELRERTILAAISSAKDELLTPRRYQETHQYDFMQKQIGEAYEEYQRLLEEQEAAQQALEDAQGNGNLIIYIVAFSAAAYVILLLAMLIKKIYLTLHNKKAEI